MNRDALQHVLKQAGFDNEIVSIHDLSGGCIHQAVRLELEGGRCLVAKHGGLDQAGMFESEADSLGAGARHFPGPCR